MDAPFDPSIIAHHYSFDGDLNDSVGEADGKPVGDSRPIGATLVGTASLSNRAGEGLNAIAIDVVLPVAQVRSRDPVDAYIEWRVVDVCHTVGPGQLTSRQSGSHSFVAST